MKQATSNQFGAVDLYRTSNKQESNWFRAINSEQLIQSNWFRAIDLNEASNKQGSNQFVAGICVLSKESNKLWYVQTKQQATRSKKQGSNWLVAVLFCVICGVDTCYMLFVPILNKRPMLDSS